MASSLLDYALSYAARGWYVFPCREKPGAPFIRNETIIQRKNSIYYKWFKDNRDAKIKAWWRNDTMPNWYFCWYQDYLLLILIRSM